MKIYSVSKIPKEAHFRSVIEDNYLEYDKAAQYIGDYTEQEVAEMLDGYTYNGYVWWKVTEEKGNGWKKRTIDGDWMFLVEEA